MVTLTSLDISLTLESPSRVGFGAWGDIADLDEVITAQQQAVRLAPDGHPDKPGSLNTLRISFRSRLEPVGDIADLDEAITVNQQAVRLIPNSRHNKPRILNNLGKSFLARLSHHDYDATFAQTISTYSQSAKSSSGLPSHRFTGACIWAKFCFSVRSNGTITAYSVVIDLLPRVVWLGRTVEQRYKDISTLGDIVTDAAAAAVHLGNFDLALEWLVQGR
jgi:hypothetical protein